MWRLGFGSVRVAHGPSRPHIRSTFQTSFSDVEFLILCVDVCGVIGIHIVNVPHLSFFQTVFRPVKNFTDTGRASGGNGVRGCQIVQILRAFDRYSYDFHFHSPFQGKNFSSVCAEVKPREISRRLTPPQGSFSSRCLLCHFMRIAFVPSHL